MSKRTWMLTATAAALLAVGAAVFFVASRKQSTTGRPSGQCALVNVSRTLPPFTVFYGVSCSGAQGTWFLNVVEGGPDDTLRPSYALRWSFARGARSAAPSGRVAISPTATSDVAVSMTAGVMAIHGTRKPDVNVSATGKLTVTLTGTAAAPVLRFTEDGLGEAERQLGLVSPFDTGGQPLRIPVTLAAHASGCRSG